MIKALVEIIQEIFWLIVRRKKQADENKPQAELDKARTDAALGNDTALNTDLDFAADKLRNSPTNSPRD